MRPKTTISISEARKRIFEIADEVQKPGNVYTFTENGRPKAVMMSAEEFESWAETAEVRRECPDLAKHIQEAEGEYKKGEYIGLEEVFAKQVYVVADKPKKKYGVQISRAKKSAKRAR